MTSPTNCPCDAPPNTEAEIARALSSIAAGQSALARQVRTFPGVREALLASLPGATTVGEHGEAIQPLAAWRARNSRDLGLMLLEMWAYVSDVLSFYDERIANESYIRTAQRPISLRRLVELLGYIPAPGIAGSVTLAAIAEGRKAVALPVATAFRSDAFGDQPPQVFEITQPTTIHPFKNEWTIGPIPQTILPQLTPTQIEQQPNGNTPTPGEYLVFETLEFGLAVDRLALITVAGVPTPTTVLEIKSFAGKDGRTYAEVRFSQPVRFPGPGPGADVKVPTVTAVVTRFPRPRPEGQQQPPPVDTDPDTGLTIVFLDSVYRQLRPGDRLIVTGAGDPLFDTVAEVAESPVVVQAASESPPVPAVTVPVTKITLSSLSLPTAAEQRNKLTFHFAFVDGGRVTAVADTEATPQKLTSELLPIQGNVERPPELAAPSGFDSSVLDQPFLLTDPDGNGALVDGRMFFGASGRAQLSIVEDPFATPPPLPADQYKTPISVFGNVITATRGETVFNEVLGSGDPRVPNQTFTLKKKPLTYTDAPNELGRESSLRLSVDGVRWKEVRTFFSCGENDHVYIVRHDAEQNTIITFGDGVRGARVPSGVSNVRATYRFGSGAAAPPAGAIAQLARPVIGLRGVRSPIAAVPGRDPDSPETLRIDAPVSARLLGRAVSPQDFEALANLERGVVRATADFLWLETEQQAGVTITYIGERNPEDLAAKLAELGELGLVIKPIQAIADPARLVLSIVAHPDFEREPLEVAVRNALLDPISGPLSIAKAPIGGPFLLSPLYELLHSIPGVVAISGVVLSSESGAFFNDTLGGRALVCFSRQSYLDFTAAEAVTIDFVDPTGPVTASRQGGC